MTQSDANVIDSSMVPDTVVSVRDLFGIDLDLEVPAFSESCLLYTSDAADE